MNTVPEDALVFEDSKVGVQAAWNARIPVIMVPDLVMPNLELRELTVTVQSDLFGVQKFLDKFGDL